MSRKTFSIVAAAAALALPALAQESAQLAEPGAAPVDVFHPDTLAGKPQPAPRWGGRVIVHIASLPENLNYAIENSAYTRRMLYEAHEMLVHQDWETHEWTPRAAESWVTEDMLVLDSAQADAYGDAVVETKVRTPGVDGQQVDARVIYGEVTDNGDTWRVRPLSEGSALSETLEVAKGDVQRVERGSVFTFSIREGVEWHPSLVYAGDAQAQERIGEQYLDARDVLFSWSIYQNPAVDCDEKRFQFEKVTKGEVVDEMTVRFFYEKQYAFAIDSIGNSMTLLPSHIFDLSDPDNPAHDPKASPEQQAEHINSNPHNRQWVGIGPYRVVEFSQQWVQMERFDGYFDPENGGYVDAIRYRLIEDDETAFSALINGEVDWFERVKSADYFGARTETQQFEDSFYKGYFYLGTYGYTGWNLYRPALKDPVVRKAIAHAFDFEEYKRTNYKGLANQVTGPFPYNSAAYNHDVEPLEYDPDLAIELLEDNGWYDRNGDGTIDKDGVELDIEFLMPSGNDASKNFGLKLQESLAELGIALRLKELEWATFLERLKSRDFDSCNLAWVPQLESDPEQLWHSKWGAPEARGSNNAGVRDPEIDKLILEGQRELDFERRQEIWHRMHERLYEIQPYLFMYNVPKKFAISRKIRGFQTFAIDPGYSVRRWYFTDDVRGTRSTRDAQ